MITPEGRIKQAVRKVLDRLKAYSFAPVQTGMGARTLDFLVCYQGHFFAIETKKAGEKPTALQQLCISKIIKAGGDAIVIDSVEKAELLEHWMKTHANPDYSEDQMRDMREQA
jgi:hypothetical protein